MIGLLSSFARPRTLILPAALVVAAVGHAQTRVETYTLQDVRLGTGASAPLLTGSFDWTYPIGDFENGSGKFSEISIPWYDPGLENLITTIEPGQIEITLDGNWHDRSIDISLFLLPDFAPGQSSLIDTTRSSYHVELGVIHAGTVGGGSLEPGLTFQSYCFGDGSGTSCPCGNAGDPGAGCANSTGQGASLTGQGSDSLASDDLQLSLSGGPSPSAALLFAGTNQIQGGAGLPFGDGLRCAGGQVQRLGVRLLDGSGSATWGPGLAATGGWSAGDERFFQGWYRDVNGTPCGEEFNLTSAVGLSFSP